MVLNLITTKEII